jgi:hypothetical protein
MDRPLLKLCLTSVFLIQKGVANGLSKQFSAHLNKGIKNPYTEPMSRNVSMPLLFCIVMNSRLTKTPYFTKPLTTRLDIENPFQTK